MMSATSLPRRQAQRSRMAPLPYFATNVELLQALRIGDRNAREDLNG